jgi:hypothetical protein
MTPAHVPSQHQLQFFSLNAATGGKAQSPENPAIFLMRKVCDGGMHTVITAQVI